MGRQIGEMRVSSDDERTENTALWLNMVLVVPTGSNTEPGSSTPNIRVVQKQRLALMHDLCRERCQER